MSRTQKTWAGIFTAAIFIAMEIAALAMLSGTSSIQDIWINRASHRVMAVLWGGGEKIRGYFHLRDQNETLAGENFQLLTELMRCKNENEQLKAMVAIQDAGFAPGFVYTPAVITKMGRNTQHNYIIIDKGSADGIKPHSGIITARGAIGIISAVDEHYSYGLTFMNEKVCVSSRVLGSETVAPLEWNGVSSNMAILRKIPMHLDIAPGDTVVTSGYSNIYPAGIPVGICGKTYLMNGAEKVSDVTLFEDFSALKYVVVARNPLRDVINELSEMEEEQK